MKPEDFDEIDAILDDLRTRFDETPQWEFCEGFMAALMVSRRVIPLSEYLPVLLGISAPDDVAATEAGQEGSFKDAAQAQRFMALWTERWSEVAEALKTEVEDLEDDRAYHPEVMDVRGAVARLPEAERAVVADEELPAFAQVWAVGFMYAVESWPDEWVPPKDKEARKWLDEALDAIVALTEDDEGEPTISPFDDEGPPTLSLERLEVFGSAVWAVYDLRTLWREVGPRVETVRKTAEPGRNDPCYCGSGKKFKKCHGA